MIERAIILPFGEDFNENVSGAAGIFVYESLKNLVIKKYNEKSFNQYIIYGSSKNVYKKFKKIYFKTNAEKKLFSNIRYINNFIYKFKNQIISNIEIHNRPGYAKSLIDAFPCSKIFIFYHNDPQKLRGSKSIKERKFLNNRCVNIFLSNYVKKCFYSGLEKENKKNSYVIYPGVKKINKIKNKKKLILFVGKLNQSKGYDIFIKAAENIRKDKRFKKWKFISIGDEKRRVIDKSQNVRELGVLPHKKVLNLYRSASIAIAPSNWDEPLGRLPIESAAHGCIPISSNKGGLVESNKNGIIKKNINENKITHILKKLCLDNNLKKKNVHILKKFKLTDNFFVKQINRIRTLKTNIKNVLHIANFNYKNKSRLFYSFSNKINYGLIDNNFKLFKLSDRDFLRSNRKIIDPLGTISFNRKILHEVKTNKIDVIILGHTQKIFEKTFVKIREINNSIIIVKLYIDSISPEFFNFKKVFYDFKYINKIYISSDVRYLNNIYPSKFSFLQYPVHKKIDYLKSFNNKKKTIDVFYATSHGVNRGVLKKGKKDERYGFISYLNNNLKSYKNYFPGFNNEQPIWGRNFYKALFNSKIAINYSRGKFKNLYSSDRIASLIGNGCFVLNEKQNFFYKKFNSRELVNFENKSDLVRKIKYFLQNEKLIKTIAKNCYYKYHYLYNAKKVVKKIIKLDNF